MATNDDTVITVNLRMPVKRQLLRDLLVTAIEGGSNYWAQFLVLERDAELNYLKVSVQEQEPSGKRRVTRTVTPERLSVGLQRLGQCAATGKFADGTPFPGAGRHLADVFNDYDATTADVVLQMTMFNDLVYG